MVRRTLLLGLAVSIWGFVACGTDQLAGSSNGVGAGSSTEMSSVGNASGGAAPGSTTDGSGGGNFVSGVGVGGGTGGDDTCAGVTETAQLVPLDMYVMLDSSGSMTEKTGKMGKGVVKWDAITTALDTFLKAPSSTGIGVGIQFFPLLQKGVPTSCTSDMECGPGAPCLLKLCSISQAACSTNQDCGGSGGQCVDLGECANQLGSYCLPVGGTCPGNQGQCVKVSSSFCVNGDSCEAKDYATPAVGIAPLPGVQSALDMAVAGVTPDGATPTSAALQGAVDYAGDWAQKNPNHVTVVVLATDGAPTRCEPTEAAGVAKIAETAANANPKVLTFVVGIIAPNETGPKKLLNDVAVAGGTSSAFFVDPQSQNVAQEFQQALEAIRGKALACEYLVPEPSEGEVIDYTKVNVEHTPAGANKPVTLFYVESEDKCDPMTGGWFYDVNPKDGTPTTIRICPASCTSFQMGGSVNIRVGCETVRPPVL